MDVDLYVSCEDARPTSPNGFYINEFDKTGAFRHKVDGIGGNDHHRSRNHAILDADNNGYLDVVNPQFSSTPVHLFLNNSRHKNNYMKIDLVGRSSNKDAFGAEVIVKTQDGNQKLIKLSTNAYLSQPSTYLHVGLGKQVAIDSVIVYWPYPNSVDRYSGADFKINAKNRVIEGNNNVRVFPDLACGSIENLQIDPIPTNIYNTDTYLSAKGLIDGSTDVQFISNTIELLSGFTVEPNATFTATIDGCQ